MIMETTTILIKKSSAPFAWANSNNLAIATIAPVGKKGTRDVYHIDAAANPTLKFAPDTDSAILELEDGEVYETPEHEKVAIDPEVYPDDI